MKKSTPTSLSLDTNKKIDVKIIFKINKESFWFKVR